MYRFICAVLVLSAVAFIVLTARLRSDCVDQVKCTWAVFDTTSYCPMPGTLVLVTTDCDNFRLRADVDGLCFIMMTPGTRIQTVEAQVPPDVAPLYETWEDDSVATVPTQDVIYNVGINRVP